ncbi:glycosyltransferase [Halorubrum sp. ASP121]|uniref:glycosyltransferase n=1 Tax=Halorubrum sp. ASP121 TaxID=1855858 RepID=UPI0010F65DA8|nr:glycosyltransferase [Halorubrum sp. ASP121]TKX48931.1 glycosyltransferase [Halorubrum sp. ASP121]
MSDLNILFHTPQPLDTLDSGSSVRPVKMIDAFEHLGYSVDKVTGDTEERCQRFKDIRRNKRKYEFCYSEPTTWPLHPLVDYPLYWYLRVNNIPTGIFYRDIYWQFPKLFDYSGLKYWELQSRYRLDLIVISRIANKVYVPSSSFSERLNLNPSPSPLPPGGVDRTSVTDSDSRLQRLIYVGGLSERYGPDLLSKACRVAANQQEVALDLVCRKSEFHSLPEKVRERFDSDWVKIHHASGDELQSLYQHADAGIIPIQPTSYNHMSMPVKLFEYLSYGLPVVTTNLDEVASFVRSSDCGIVCEANHNDLARALTKLTTDQELYQRKKESAVQTLMKNRWIDRAEQVVSDLVPNQNSTDTS